MRQRECEKPIMTQHWAAIIWTVGRCEAETSSSRNLGLADESKTKEFLAPLFFSTDNSRKQLCAYTYTCSCALLAASLKWATQLNPKIQARLCVWNPKRAKKETGVSYCYCYCYWRSVTISLLAFQRQVMATILPSHTQQRPQQKKHDVVKYYDKMLFTHKVAALARSYTAACILVFPAIWIKASF